MPAGNGQLDGISDAGLALSLDNQGNIYVVGQYVGGAVTFPPFSLASSSATDIFVVKYNTTGHVQWVTRAGAGGPQRDNANGVAVDSLGNIYVTGYATGNAAFDTFTTPLNAIGAFFLACYNSTGQVQWLSYANSVGVDSNAGNSVVVDSSGNILVAGQFFGTATFVTSSSSQSVATTSFGNQDAFVVKYNSSGVPQWVTRFGSSADLERAASIAVDSLGSVYVAGNVGNTVTFGTISTSGSGTDAFVVQLSSASGQLNWFARASGPGATTVYGLALDRSNAVYITGSLEGSSAFNPKAISSIGSFDVFIATVAAVCTNCPMGTFSTTLGIYDITMCTNCPGGKVSDIVGAATSSACVSCLPGYYSDDGASQCSQCPVGTFSMFSGGAYLSSCLNCTAGQYTSQTGSTSCIQCFAGTYALPRANKCEFCPPGTFSGVSGAPSSNSCIPCVAGQYSALSGATSCQLCNPGTYSASNASIVCVACPRGTYLENYGGKSVLDCKPCAAGYFSFSAGASSEVSCLPCQQGTYSTTVGATNSTVCNACPPGSYNGLFGANKCV